jgi:hypothetical protein
MWEDDIKMDINGTGRFMRVLNGIRWLRIGPLAGYCGTVTKLNIP